MSRIGTNDGHGHVWARPDGLKARCGGPNLCSECARDFAETNRTTTPAPMSAERFTREEIAVLQLAYAEAFTNDQRLVQALLKRLDAITARIAELERDLATVKKDTAP